MSWIHKLYDTYQSVQGNALFDGEGRRPLPIGHIFANAHIEVTVSGAGDFISADVLSKDDCQTCIPCTENSGSRSGKQPPPHPLVDKLQYVAGDFHSHGGKVTVGFQNDPTQPHNDYVDALQDWYRAFPHPKLKAILSYVRKGRLVADLKERAVNVIPFDPAGQFVVSASKEEKDLWPIWKVLGPSSAPQDAVVRWRVELAPGTPDTSTWDDPELIHGWCEYAPTTLDDPGLCMVTGVDATLTTKHPRGIRNPADGAKLISSNDKTGFTFRGRFTDDGAQAVSVGYEVSQKAHNALRWLIARQGQKSAHGDQVFVAWAVSGKPIPSPFGELGEWDEDAEGSGDVLEEEEQTEAAPDHGRDIGQSYARRLNQYMAGYGDIDDPTEDIVILGLNSASPGRLAIIYYRELKGSELLARLRTWHLAMAWPQRFSRKQTDAKGKSNTVVNWRVAAPAPDLIAEVAYGRRLDDKLRKATIERLIPCIIDGQSLPRDLVVSCAHRASHGASHRTGQEAWQWEQALGVACALFKGFHETHPDPCERRSYHMALEPTRTSRDYLFGRLLAIAENIEQTAIYYAGEKQRSTSAERLMHHFANQPSFSWRTIELSLDPYFKRLHSRAPALLKIRKDLLDEIIGLFNPDDFTDNSRLGPEFLLGFHCQRLEFRRKSKTETAKDSEGDDK